MTVGIRGRVLVIKRAPPYVEGKVNPVFRGQSGYPSREISNPQVAFTINKSRLDLIFQRVTPYPVPADPDIGKLPKIEFPYGVKLTYPCNPVIPIHDKHRESRQH